MEPADDPDIRDPDAGFDDDPEQDPGEELEAVIDRADRPFAAESFGTTGREEAAGESLDQRLAEERSGGAVDEAAFVIEDADGPDEEGEMLGEASLEHDPFLAPEEAAVHVREEDDDQD